MVEVRLLGIFEDSVHRDFVSALVGAALRAAKLSPTIDARLTRGCHVRVFQEHAQRGGEYRGIVVGIDARKARPSDKRQCLARYLPRTDRVLWCVARPSVDEWLLSDTEALRLALAADHDDVGPVHHPSRRASAEGTAKDRLRNAVSSALGFPPLRGGREYAAEVGARVSAARVGARRNPDLHQLLTVDLPRFVRSLTTAS